jgi:hypothetical protein
MGRSNLLLVMGFNVLFASIGFNLSKVSTRGYENYLEYYNASVCRHIASSAANMASSELTFNPNWRVGYETTNFANGTYKVEVLSIDSQRVKLEVTANFNGIEKEAIVLLGLTKFSKFAYYSVIEGTIYWITGDTVWGPFHTQAKLSVAGKPTFYGKVSAKNGIYKNPSTSKPDFYAGFQSGVNINLPNDFSALKGYAQSGGQYWTGKNIYMEFLPNGNVTWRDGSWTATPTTVSVASLAPNGVLMADNANLHIKGKLNGRLTISATGTTTANGNVWIDSSVTYTDNPMTTTSDDMLGIVCTNNVIITDNANNTNIAKGVNLHASILTSKGGLMAENYSSRGKSGTLTLLGGVQQYQRGAVGTFSGGVITSGFLKNYRYDERLMVDSPPLYPTTGSYEVLSWYE